MLKKIFIILLTCLVIVFKAIIFPVFYLKVKILKLDKIKPLIISTLNKIYDTDLSISDYGFDISILPGATLSKDDKYCTTLAMSSSIENGIRFGSNICENKGVFGYPVILEINHSLNRLSKFFRIKQMVYMNFKKGELVHIQLRIELNTILPPHTNPVYVNSRSFILIELTPSFELIDIRKVRMDNEFDTRKKCYTGMPTKDFFNLIYLNEIKYNHFVVELLPEIIIPSAYDFNSDDFKQRLLLVDMIEY